MVKPSGRRSGIQKEAKRKDINLTEAVVERVQKMVEKTKEKKPTEASKFDLNPIPLKGTKNKKFQKKQRQKNATLLKIQLEKEEQAKAEAAKEIKVKSKPPVTKPTKDERMTLRRLKKHEPAKAPAYAQYLAEKYNNKMDL